MIRSSRAVPRVGRRIATTPPPPLHTWQISRRCNASKADTQYPTAPTAKSIPGPSWLWLEPIYEPFRAYGRVQQRRPYMTQVVSALVVYFVGDLVAQEISIEKRQGEATAASTVGSGDDVRRGWRVVEWAEGRDWWRTGRALLIGGAAAVPGYRWFLWLGNSFNYRSKVLSLATKVTVNQLLFTPVFNTYFFGMQSLLTGASLPEIVERVRNTVPTSWINSCKIWPAVTAFMFTYVPLQYRNIFGGVIAIGWQTYLNLLNQRAAREEKLAHKPENEEVRELSAEG